MVEVVRSTFEDLFPHVEDVIKRSDFIGKVLKRFLYVTCL